MFSRMILFFQFQCCIQIYDKLQLQSVIHRSKIQSRIAGLIINDFHIDRIVLLIAVHPVNPPPQAQALILR